MSFTFFNNIKHHTFFTPGDELAIVCASFYSKIFLLSLFLSAPLIIQKYFHFHFFPQGTSWRLCAPLPILTLQQGSSSTSTMRLWVPDYWGEESSWCWVFFLSKWCWMIFVWQSVLSGSYFHYQLLSYSSFLVVFIERKQRAHYFQFYCIALQNERCSATLGITFTFKLCLLHPPEIRIRTGAVYWSFDQNLLRELICPKNLRHAVIFLGIVYFFLQANDKTVHTLDAPNNKGWCMMVNDVEKYFDKISWIFWFLGVLKESRILLRLQLERRHFR